MHFSQSKQDQGSKLTKIAIVTALHLTVGTALVKNMGHTGISKLIEDKLDVVFVKPDIIKPPPPPLVEPKPMPRQKTITETKPVIRPPIEHEVVANNVEPTITAAVSTETGPVDIRPPGPEPVAKVPSEGGAMRTAVLAQGCAKPDYPARSARNGDSGTVSLALLVGADGRVADSRIQKSSGYRELDRAAIAALSMCTFKAATSGGVAEQGWAQIAYVWTLEQ